MISSRWDSWEARARDRLTIRDLEEAKALLAEAGYPDGFDVDLTVTDLDMEGILLTDLAQKIKDDLSQVGINVNIVSQPWAAGYGDAYRDGTLGFTVMYWGTDYNDPNVQLEFLPGGVVGKRGRLECRHGSGACGHV
ncbi:MAG: ABC transporter substrate-binding protein [Enterocloster clostridioformis]